MTNTKPKKGPSAEEIQEDIDFYLALKAMPPEKLGPLVRHIEVLTPLIEEMLDAREHLARAEAALTAAKKAKHETLMTLVNARIADLQWSRHIGHDDGEPASPEDNDADDGSPRVLH